MSPRFLQAICLATGLFVSAAVHAEEVRKGSGATSATPSDVSPDAASEPTAPEPTAPEPTEAAKKEAAERFARGLAFYEDGDYGLALIEFERAYQLVPDYRVLYNIGQVSIQLSRSSQALRALRQYLKEGGDALSTERVEAVTRDVEMLNARTAHLVLTGTQGAEVLIDDESYGTLPLEAPLLLDAGRRKIEVKKDGFRSYNERLTLAGAEERQLQIELERNAPEVAVTNPTPTPTEKPGKSMTPQTTTKRGTPWPLIGWTTTGVLAGGAIVSGILGLGAANNVKNLKESPDPSRSELDSQAKTAKTWFLAADILTATALATGGVSLYFSLSGKSAEEPANGRDSEGAKPSVGVSISPTAWSLSGQF